MHSPEQVFTDLEGDRGARESEIRLLERFIQRAMEHEIGMLRRSTILVVYAHLEGFCKFALLAYAAALNSLKLKCSDASYPVAAAGLTKVFAALRDANSKHPFFKSTFPDDTWLHLMERERTFIEAYDRVSATLVEIPDQAVDTKYNVSPVVLKKMMYQLGLNYPALDPYSGKIHRLLQIRNAIAHGDRLRIPSEQDLVDSIGAVLNVMTFIQNEVFEALKNQAYLRVVPAGRAENVSAAAG
jgi:hypothetical protein